MPGIVGLITKMPREQAEAELVRMVATLRHEAFYSTGTRIDESLGVYVGWSALKNSFSDGMPLSNERGDVTLVFSGEEYPEPEAKRRLREKGHTFAMEGSSYLVHLYEEDANFPGELNGVFHGLLIDRNRGTVTLFNDRCGMHRIYYHESKDAFYFAAEAKAILAVRPELRTPTPKVWENLSPAVVCSRTAPSSRAFTSCPRGRRGFSATARWQKRHVLSSARVGKAGILEPEAYYQDFGMPSRRTSPLFQRPGAGGNGPHGRLRHPSDLGWHRACRVASLLHLRRDVSRLPGRASGTASRRAVPTVT